MYNFRDGTEPSTTSITSSRRADTKVFSLFDDTVDKDCEIVSLGLLVSFDLLLLGDN